MKKNMRSWLGGVLALVCTSGCSDDAARSTTPYDASSPLHADGGLDGATVVGLDASSFVDAAANTPDASLATVSFTLRFKAKVGADDMVCGRDYPDQGSSKVSITPRDFRFFVQEVRLITASGGEVPLTFDERLPFQTKQVALLDFTNGEGECASRTPSGNTALTGTAPAGAYTGVAFVVGVSEALNHQDPTLAPAPLQAPGVSWGWTLGYRFLMAEVLQHGGHAAAADAGGVADAGADASVARGVALLHVGSTGCSGTPGAGIHCSNANRPAVRLTGFNASSSTIVADLGAVFAQADLGGDVQCHGSEQPCALLFEALGLDLATGASSPTQRVFRLE